MLDEPDDEEPEPEFAEPAPDDECEGSASSVPVQAIAAAQATSADAAQPCMSLDDIELLLTRP
jgi:hypothetical protein